MPVLVGECVDAVGKIEALPLIKEKSAAHEYDSITFFLSYSSYAGGLLTEEERIYIECPPQMN